MSETVSYTPTYQPTPRIPSLWEKVMNRAKAEISAAGGLSGLETLCKFDTSSWLGTEERESALKASLASSLAELAICSDSKFATNGGGQIAQFRAMLMALDSLPQLSTLTHLYAGEALVRLQKEGEEMYEHAMKSGITSQMIARAQSAQQDLRAITSQAHQHLAKAEGQMLQEITGETLHQLGYCLSEKGNALRAVRGTTCIWIEINERGRMSLDVSGFSGLTCQTEIKALENGLAERGVELKRASVESHCQKAGGHIADRLASIFGAPPEEQRTNSLWGKPCTGQSICENNRAINIIKESR
jgi:hypothetical protein